MLKNREEDLNRLWVAERQPHLSSQGSTDRKGAMHLILNTWLRISELKPRKEEELRTKP